MKRTSAVTLLIVICASPLPNKSTSLEKVPAAVPIDTIIINGPVTIQHCDKVELSVDDTKNQTLELEKLMTGIKNPEKDEQRTNTKENNCKEKPKPVIPKLPAGYTEISRDNGLLVGFKFHWDKKTWNQARKACHLEGGYLGYPESASEEKKYVQILRPAKGGGAWIGLHDLFEQGDWVTVLGDTVKNLKYTDWDVTEPNNYRNVEHCAEIHVDRAGRWWDSTCTLKLFFLCKIAIPYCS